MSIKGIPTNAGKFDITHDQLVKERVEGVIHEIDYLLGHYKLAESLYPYSHLSGAAHVS